MVIPEGGAPRNQAFSLVELSIVLVILGLLVGGVLSGQSLIRASELRSLTTQMTHYVTAMNTFRDKYFALPGDMTNATSFWSAAADCSSATDDGGTTTCNGDGDGNITWGPFPDASHTNRSEIFLFWQHLANAGLIEGHYNGIKTQGGYWATSTPGVNVPKTRVGDSCVSVFNYTGDTANDLKTTFTSGNAFIAGALAANDYCKYPITTPAEQWNIDTKIDDGMPGTGNVWVYTPGVYGQNCATTNDPATAQYALTDTNVDCVFIEQF